MKQELIFLALIAITPLYGAVGCRRTGNSMSSWSDHKVLHLVQCNCPCGSDEFHKIITSKKNMCLQCRHYRFAQDCDPINPLQTNTQKSVITNKMALFKVTPWKKTRIHPKGKALHHIFKNSFASYY